MFVYSINICLLWFYDLFLRLTISTNELREFLVEVSRKLLVYMNTELDAPSRSPRDVNLHLSLNEHHQLENAARQHHRTRQSRRGDSLLECDHVVSKVFTILGKLSSGAIAVRVWTKSDYSSFQQTTDARKIYLTFR
jgi:hypothetical protein